VLRISHSNARFGQAQLAQLSARARQLVSHPASSGLIARLVEALGAVRFACTDRQRASAGPQSRAATPPSLVPRRRTRSRVAELQRRHRFAERQLKLVARIRAPEHASMCDCDCAYCSSAEPVSQACVSLVVRGVGQRSSEHHRRAADKRLLLPAIWLVDERQQRAPPTASASGTHNRSQRFVAVVLVLVRQMRTREVALAARRHAVTARVAAL
jgi:hypothetical protein